MVAPATAAAPKPVAPAAAKPAAGAHGAKAAAPLAPLSPEVEKLQEKFGASAIEPAAYVGALIKEPKQAAAVAKFVRDELQYDTLSNLTAVDYMKDSYIEVVYNFSRIGGGTPLTLKTRVPRKSGTELTEPVASLVAVYPGAEYQEREVYDMYGVPFEGHPDLRRILLWEGFHGWPMRKDWKEAYFEGETKPFESRWPGGHHQLIEERVPWEDNLIYPPGFDLRHSKQCRGRWHSDAGHCRRDRARTGLGSQ